MLRNIAGNVSPWSKSLLFRRHNIPQAVLNVRLKQNTADINYDEEDHRPIKYSSSKAANMRVDEYRLPYGSEPPPSYQPKIIALSLTVFLIYFGILREENDIDSLLYVDLETNLKRCEEEQNQKNTVKLK